MLFLADSYRSKTLILCCLLFALLLLSAAAPADVSASSAHNVKDESGYLDAEEEGRIQAEIEKAVQAYDLDIVIVITDDTEGKSSRDFADDYYDYNDYGVGSDASGLLLLINMGQREIWISTTGKAIDIFTDSRIENMLDEIAPRLTEGNHFDACMAFISEVKRYAQSGVPQDQHRIDEDDPHQEYIPQTPSAPAGSSPGYWQRAVNLMTIPMVYIIAVAVSLIATIIASAGNKGKLTVSGHTYEQSGSFHLTEKRDDFIHQTVTRVRIADNSSNKSGGSSGSRSSVHRSSSGRSHGGGGRSF